MRQLTQWQETWISSSTTSYRPGHGCEDLWLAEALKVERALLLGEPLAGISLDFAKAFDNLPHDIMLRIAAHMGMDEGILSALRGMYTGLKRRFKVGSHVGQSFSSSNGILQGCPISVLLLNMFVEVWTRAVREEVGGSCEPQAYADDVGATAKHKHEIVGVCRVTDIFSKLTGMSVHVKKSTVWATDPTLRQQLTRACEIDGQFLPLVTQDRRLGAFLSYNRRRVQTRISRTLEECRRMCQRVELLPLPLMLRAQVISSLVLPKALYACGVSPPSKRDLRSLRGAVAKAIWGQGNRWRANEALFTLVVAGHSHDPVQATYYLTITTMRRFLDRHPEVWPAYAEVLELRQHEITSTVGGPIRAFLEALRGISASMSTPGQVRYRAPDNSMKEIPLLNSDLKTFQHEIRDAGRAEQWLNLADRRSTFSGIEYGIDRKATAVLRGKTTGLHTHRLRCLFTGAVATCHRLYRAGVLDGNACRCCHQPVVGTLGHLIDDCRATQRLRDRDFSASEWASLPDCLRLHGIAPLADDWLPPRYQGEQNGKAAIVAEVQYVLLDILEVHNAALDGSVLPPQPRWRS